MAYHAKGIEQLGFVFEKDFYTIEKNGVVELVWKSYQPQPTEAECEAAKAEYDSKAYARARANAYASIGDQLDMQYHDSVNGSRTWLDHIESVKDAHPK